jgi:hypothetical protein
MLAIYREDLVVQGYIATLDSVTKRENVKEATKCNLALKNHMNDLILMPMHDKRDQA